MCVGQYSKVVKCVMEEEFELYVFFVLLVVDMVYVVVLIVVVY